MEKLEFTVMFWDEPQIHIVQDFNDVSVEYDENSIDIVTKLKVIVPFFSTSEITHKNIEEFFISRLPDKDREDIDLILEIYGICDYNPYIMCRKSHGLTMTDHLWLKFKGEEIEYADIRLR